MSSLPTSLAPTEIVDALVEREKVFRRLGKKKRAFVRALTITGGDLSKACKVAGVRRATALKWLQEEIVKKAIALDREVIVLRQNVSKDYFVTEIRRIVENPKTKPQEKIQALELLAKIEGLLREKQAGGQQNLVVFQIEGLADDGQDRGKGPKEDGNGPTKKDPPVIEVKPEE